MHTACSGREARGSCHRARDVPRDTRSTPLRRQVRSQEVSMTGITHCCCNCSLQPPGACPAHIRGWHVSWSPYIALAVHVTRYGGTEAAHPGSGFHLCICTCECQPLPYPCMEDLTLSCMTRACPSISWMCIFRHSLHRDKPLLDMDADNITSLGRYGG